MTATPSGGAEPSEARLVSGLLFPRTQRPQRPPRDCGVCPGVPELGHPPRPYICWKFGLDCPPLSSHFLPGLSWGGWGEFHGGRRRAYWSHPLCSFSLLECSLRSQMPCSPERHVLSPSPQMSKSPDWLPLSAGISAWPLGLPARRPPRHAGTRLRGTQGRRQPPREELPSLQLPGPSAPAASGAPLAFEQTLPAAHLSPPCQGNGQARDNAGRSGPVAAATAGTAGFGETQSR